MDYITRIMANARIKCTGAVDAALRLELFNVLDEFCKETDVWREAIQVTTVAGDVEYTLTPTEGRCLRLLELYTTNGQVGVGGSMPVPGELRLFREQEAGMLLDAIVSLIPVDPTDTDDFPIVADWLWERYTTEFIDGLLYKMMVQTGKPYSNPQLAMYHGRKWRNAISVARADTIKQNKADGQAWRFPRYAPGSQRW